MNKLALSLALIAAVIIFGLLWMGITKKKEQVSSHAYDLPDFTMGGQKITNNKLYVAEEKGYKAIGILFTEIKTGETMFFKFGSQMDGLGKNYGVWGMQTIYIKDY